MKRIKNVKVTFDPDTAPPTNRSYTQGSIAVGDKMFWEMQDFDFCPNLIKFYQIHLNFSQNLSKFTQICPDCLKKFAMGHCKGG